MMAARGQKHFSVTQHQTQALHWHISVHTGGGKRLLPFPDWLIRWCPLYSLGKNRLLAVLVQDTKEMQTESDDKAERKS